MKDPLAAYRSDGYVLFAKVYSPAEIACMRLLIDEDYRSRNWHGAPNSNDHLTTDIYERMPELAGLVFNDRYLDAVRKLFSPEPVILVEPAVHKGRYYYWHKDSTFIDELGEDYHWQPDFQGAMTVLYLQDNHPDYGGGITLIPGTQSAPDFYHRIPAMSLLERAALKAKKLLRMSHFDRMDRHAELKPIRSQAGDVLFLDMRLDHKGTPALKPAPVTKYGIMNIACSGHKTAHSLRRTLRNRPSKYYSEYLASQPLQTPQLAALSQRHGLDVWL